MSIRSVLVQLLLVIAFVGNALAISATGSRLLVVLDPSLKDEDYSLFFSDLDSRGLDLTIKAANDPSLGLFEYGERIYDHLILTLPPTQKALGPNLLAKPLLDFSAAGGNIVVVLNANEHALASVREFANQLDVFLPFRDTKLVDHFSYDKEASPLLHDALVLSPNSLLAPEIVSPTADDASKLLYYPGGSAFSLGNNQLLVPVLAAPETAYIYDPAEEATKSETPFATGSQAFLVASLQTRKNTRVTFVASNLLFTNDAFTKPDSFNRAFAAQLSAWTFAEKSVLRLESVTHRLVNSSELNPSIYRVKNEIEYEVELSRFTDGKWAPFYASDVQLEFTMLDPYYRLTLIPSSSSPSAQTYTTSFIAPDQHGMFSFVLNYKRPGLSFVEDKRVVTLRHFGHNEFARSFEIPNAWPYATSIFVVVAAWLLFVALWMFSANSESPSVKKTQ
ncbi:Dolichyl-diphosphooligosaccharide--protein glycosyltransferase subunit WBP1 [Myxozyma melibiosi]|uniref:Dolichyl-diphosphooligosaccharide--protein glycosyltransferase subunit WBP1 n=1 Tax=Myxozyma melibiosi TaxID=54550 RepID=A0ABR1F5N1_9ASCO